MKKLLIVMLALVASVNVKAEDYTNFIASDNILGKITAPVTFIEYASMTCGHCAHFDEDAIRKLKKEYVETGKVAYTFRDLPFDDLAMAVSKVNRCAPKKSFYKYLSAFFKTQRQWIFADDKLEAITHIAQMGGMKKSDVKACILNPKVQQEIQKSKDSAMVLGINATPAFIINGKIHTGALSYSKVKALIEAELAK